MSPTPTRESSRTVPRLRCCVRGSCSPGVPAGVPCKAFNSTSATRERSSFPSCTVRRSCSGCGVVVSCVPITGSGIFSEWSTVGIGGTYRRPDRSTGFSGVFWRCVRSPTKNILSTAWDAARARPSWAISKFVASTGCVLCGSESPRGTWMGVDGCSWARRG